MSARPARTRSIAVALLAVATLPIGCVGCCRRELLFGPEPNTWTPTFGKSGLGNGRLVIEQDPDGCGLDCLDWWGKGLALRVTALPDARSRFEGWSRGCEGTGPCLMAPDKFWLGAVAHFADTSAEWSRVVASRTSGVVAAALAVDADGNALVAGPDEDFLSRFDASGQRLFRLNGGRGAVARAVAHGPDTSAIVVGTVQREESITTEAGSWLGRSEARERAFVAKIASDGHVVWARVLRGSESCRLEGVAVDAAGTAFVAGGFQGSLELGSDRLESSKGAAFVARVSPEGSFEWSRALVGGGGGPASATSIVLAPDRGPIVVANTSSQRAVEALRIVDSARGEMATEWIDEPWGPVVVALSNGGEERWAWARGGVNIAITAIAGLPDGDVVLGGSVKGRIAVAGRELAPIGGPEYADALLIRLSTPGIERWGPRFGGAENDAIAALIVGHNGDVRTTGTFTGAMHIGSAVLESEGFTKRPGSTSPPDGFVATFTAAGSPRFAERFGHESADAGWGLGADANGAVYRLVEHLADRKSGNTFWGEHELVLVKHRARK